MLLYIWLLVLFPQARSLIMENKKINENKLGNEIIKDLLDFYADKQERDEPVYIDTAIQRIKDIAKKYDIVLHIEPIELKDLACGETFTYNGYEFTKLADEEESCYCLLNDSVFESKFGETNDWVKSPIRKKLNEFDENGNSKVLPNINENDLVEVSLNYYAYKIPNGRTADRITCLSWEEYYAYESDSISKASWLRSGGNVYANNAHALSASGLNYGSTVSSVAAVRPALHLKSNLKIKK